MNRRLESGRPPAGGFSCRGYNALAFTLEGFRGYFGDNEPAWFQAG